MVCSNQNYNRIIINILDETVTDCLQIRDISVTLIR